MLVHKLVSDPAFVMTLRNFGDLHHINFILVCRILVMPGLFNPKHFGEDTLFEVIIQFGQSSKETGD